MKFKIGSLCIQNNETLATIIKYDEVYTLQWARPDMYMNTYFNHTEEDLERWSRTHGKIVSFNDYIDASRE